MNTDVLSIAGALKRNAGPVALIVIELSALMAVLCNVLFLVSDYARLTTIPTGVDERELAVVQRVGVIGASGDGNFGETMHTLMSVPGVVSAAFGAVPFLGAGAAPVFLTAGQRSPTVFAHEFWGSQGFDRVLGVHLLAGHLPTEAELPRPGDQQGLQGSILVTQALAQRLFPGNRTAINQLIYVSAPMAGVIPARIVGVIDSLRGAVTGAPEDDYSFLLESYFSSAMEMGGLYAMRTRPGQAQAVLHDAQVALTRQDHGATVLNRAFTVADLRAQNLADTVSNVWTLGVVLGILSLLALCGLTALTAFWVQRRRVHIGIRRALGATRGNILHYFQVENALIVGVGICVGAVLALALNHLLVRLYAIPALPLPYLLAAGSLLLILGQVAALAPALRAAATPPSTALRATY